MSVICLPSSDFSYENLDQTNSVFTESSIVPTAPTPTAVSGEYNLFASTIQGITEAYDIDYRVADNGSGTIGGRTSARFIYRDTEETGSYNDWYGWSDLDRVRDIWQVNTSQAGGSNQYQYPRSCMDKHGNIYVAYKYDSRVGLSIRNTAGTWTEYRTTSNAPVLIGTNNAPGTTSRTDPDIVYVEETDSLYLFWVSWNAANTKTSIGVSVSTDQGITWKVLTYGILPLASGLAYTSTSNDYIRSTRALYNPISKTFTVTFIYNDGTDDFVYSTTVSNGLYITSWGETYRYKSTHDLVLEPITGKEYVLMFQDSDNTLNAYYKYPGDLFWTSGDTTTDANFSAGVGIAGFLHHTGQPCFIYADTTDEDLMALIIDDSGDFYNYDDDYENIGAGSNHIISGVTSRLEKICALRWQDRVIVFGNPQGVSTTHEDELLGYHLGGWDNLPQYTIDSTTTRAIINPWDELTDQDRTGFIWTKHDGGAGATCGPIWQNGFLNITTESASANEANYDASFANCLGYELIYKVKIADTAYTTIQSTGTSTKNGYIYFEVESYDGGFKTHYRINMTETEFNVYDVMAAAYLGSDIAVTFLDTFVYVKVINQISSGEIVIYYSTDGMTWTEVFDTILTSSVDATAATSRFEFGVESAAAGTCIAGWQMITLLMSTANSNADELEAYNDYDDAYTGTIALSGMPLSLVPNWVSKGLLISGTGTSALSKDLWEFTSAAEYGIKNVLIDGEDSPRIKWVQGDSTTANLRWTFTSTPFDLSRGFLYIDATGISQVVLKGYDNSAASLTTLCSQTLSRTLGGSNNWSRDGNMFYPTSASTSNYWYKKDELKGCYLTVSTRYYLIHSNTPGYWNSATGDMRMRIRVSGDPSGEASSGSSLAYTPKQILILFSESSPIDAFRYFTLDLTSTGGSGVVEASTIRIGEYYAIPYIGSAGRGVMNNHERTMSSNGISRGRVLGPASRTRSITTIQYDPSTKYSTPSSIATHTYSFDGTNEEVDANIVAEMLEYAVRNYGQATPIIWCDKWTTSPASGTTSGIMSTNSSDFLFGYIEQQSLNSSIVGMHRSGEIISTDTFTIRELV